MRFPNNTEVLDEIVLETKIEPKVTRNPRLIGGTMVAEKLLEKDARTQRLSRYLERKGFRLYRISAGMAFWVIPTKMVSSKSPIVYLNGFRSLEPINDILLASVDEIYYDHSNNGESDSGEIHIYTRYKATGKYLDTKLLQAVAKVGFSIKSSDTKLKFTSFVRNHFISFGTVYWNPDIELEKDETIKVKFPSYALKEFRIFINGFSDKGDIISSSKYISVD